MIRSGAIRIRVQLAADCEGRQQAFVRASSNGQVRVPESTIVFNHGEAEIDLPVVGISNAAVQTLDESWTWECRIPGADYTQIEVAYAGAVYDQYPVRLYFTAARSISACPRESFYHVACITGSATNAIEAERNVWTSFTRFQRGQVLTNAKGQRLGFWRDNKPGPHQPHYITRDARDLVTHTDSSCRGWAELLHEAFAIHGIESAVRAVRPKPSAVLPRLGLPTFQIPNEAGIRSVVRTVGILVKPFKWKPQQELSPFPFAPEECEINAGGFKWKIDNPVDTGATDWPEPDVTDLLRLGHASTQEGNRIGGMFGNHAVVLVQRDNRQSWYDPSFGFGPHESLLDYENTLLGRGEENHGGLFAIIGWKREMRVNPQTGATEEHNAGLLLGAAPPPPGAMLEAVDPG